MFIASIADIKKALYLKSTTNLYIKIPKHFSKYLDLADHTEANKLLPLYRPGINHCIKLQEVDSKTPEVL